MLSQVKYSDLPSYDLGLEQGIEQGVELGIEKGVELGMEQGRRQEAAKLLTVLLDDKFGDLSLDIKEKISLAPLEQIEAWIRQVLQATSLDELLNA
jgi:hypothetical protein